MKLLDEVVLDALELHASYEIPKLELPGSGKRLVVASGNALPTGRILFHDAPAVFAGESQYARALEQHGDLGCATVISASGEKHAPAIVRDLVGRGLSTSLVTCRADSTAAGIDGVATCVTRSLPEPITYNTSTYLGMVLAKTRESASAIRSHIEQRVAPALPDFRAAEAFYLLVRPEHDVIREMFITKFDELFGGRVTARCYTFEQTLHAKTVVPYEREMFVGIGVPNEDFGTLRLDVPLPDEAGFAAAISVGYWVIGRIQARFPGWFLEHAKGYEKLQKELFAKHGA